MLGVTGNGSRGETLPQRPDSAVVQTGENATAWKRREAASSESLRHRQRSCNTVSEKMLICISEEKRA